VRRGQSPVDYIGKEVNVFTLEESAVLSQLYHGEGAQALRPSSIENVWTEAIDVLVVLRCTTEGHRISGPAAVGDTLRQLWYWCGYPGYIASECSEDYSHVWYSWSTADDDWLPSECTDDCDNC